MSEKQNEKDVDISEMVSFSSYAPKRQENAEEKETAAERKEKKVSFIIFTALSFSLSLAYILTTFILGRRNDGYSSANGYGVLPLLFASLTSVFAALSVFFLFYHRWTKKELFSSLSIISSYLSFGALYTAYSFSIIRKAVIEKINISGSNFFEEMYLVFLIIAWVLVLLAIFSSFILMGKKKNIVCLVLVLALSSLIYGAGAVLVNPISFFPSGIALSVIGSLLVAIGRIGRLFTKKGKGVHLFSVSILLGYAGLLSALLYYGLLLPSPLY